MEHDKYLDIVMDLQDDKDFKIEKGKAKAISEKELDKKYYSWVNKQNLSRDFDTALEERINNPLENGMLMVRNPDGSIKFDDRKLRYDKCELENNMYTFYTGPAHFGENQATNIPSLSDKQLHDYFRDKGITNFNDSKAYFANIIATNVTLETKEGYILVFKRSTDSEIYADHWHVIGGHINTDLKIFEKKNPTKDFKKIISNQILAELREELAIKPKKFKITGFVYGVSGADFTYMAETDETTDEILKKAKHAQDATDHSSFKKLNPEQLAQFLLEEPHIVPVGFGSLLLYLKHKDKRFYEKVKKESKHTRIF